MLRFHYMPSDFHPLLLIVGERSDISVLGDLFSSFSQSRHETRVDSLPSFGYQSIGITIVPVDSNDSRGVILSPEGGESMIWELSSDKALEYAEEIAEIVDGKSKSGSCFLEIGYVGEIRAKVVFGEFDDSYLLEGRL